MSGAGEADKRPSVLAHSRNLHVVGMISQKGGFYSSHSQPIFSGIRQTNHGGVHRLASLVSPSIATRRGHCYRNVFHMDFTGIDGCHPPRGLSRGRRGPAPANGRLREGDLR